MGTNTLPDRTKTRKPPVLEDFKVGKILYGAINIDQRIRPAKAGVDCMTSWTDWLNGQNGAMPGSGDQFETTSRFIMTPRDLATYVHFDALYEAYLNACLILLEMGAAPIPACRSPPWPRARKASGYSAARTC
jgi:hypothetical protein